MKSLPERIIAYVETTPILAEVLPYFGTRGAARQALLRLVHSAPSDWLTSPVAVLSRPEHRGCAWGRIVHDSASPLAE